MLALLDGVLSRCELQDVSSGAINGNSFVQGQVQNTVVTENGSERGDAQGWCSAQEVAAPLPTIVGMLRVTTDSIRLAGPRDGNTRRPRRSGTATAEGSEVLRVAQEAAAT